LSSSDLSLIDGRYVPTFVMTLSSGSFVRKIKAGVWWIYRSAGCHGRTHWLCGWRRGSVAAHLLGLRDRIPLGAWVSVSCECCVLSGTSLCDGPITRPEDSYRVWCVWV